MSRNIAVRSEVTYANMLKSEKASADSRLIISSYGNYFGLFLFQNNRLVMIKAVSTETKEGEIILARVKNIKQNISAVFFNLDSDTEAFAKISNIPDRYKPLKQGQLIPVRIIADEQKGKRISVTAKIGKMNIPLGWEHKTAYTVLSSPSDPLTKYISDTFSYGDFVKILTDSEEAYNLLINSTLKDDFSCEISKYNDEALSLSGLFSVKTRLEEALSQKVYLKCGGNLVINKTEALTVIDVNSGKNISSEKITAEESNLKINLEAAQEIALQLKLRNISGMILIDFINLSSDESKNELLSAMDKAVLTDNVTVKVIDITPLGIMEITRQKKDKPLSEFADIFYT